MKLTEKIVSKELLSDNLIKSIEYYSHVSDIVNRTYSAMGRNRTYEVTNVSSNDVTFNSNGLSRTN